MAFTFGVSRTSILLAAVAACASWANPSFAGGSMDECARYAEDAFYAVDDMKKAGCSGVDRSGGPGRFTVNYNEHFNWCRNESTEKTRASEKKARDAAKNKCLPTLEELVCADFATKGVEASRQWQVFRCTTEHHPTGRFSYKYNDHYNSCMKSGGVNAADEDEARTKELDACKQANSDSRHKKVTKLGVKRTVEDQSADEDVSEEAFDAPARKHRTQRIVVGNRYVEVPAFDEDTDDDGSRVGSVVKAGAAAVVVGTAAVATGVVAAKAIDYVEDHKGGISEAAHDLKDKIKDRLTPSRSGELSQAASGLKDKIKDRLGDGGGFNKVATGLKDKIKDRLTPSRSGGPSKAASGLKEKFKSRLAGGGGDGIGSKMKGVAKAGGGLLRRLAGR